MDGGKQHMNPDNKELNIAKTAAIDSEIGNLAKGSFIATLSHELRIPMNSIMGMLKLLEDTDLTDRQKDYIASAHEASEYLLSWIKEITRFTTINTEEFCIEDEPFDMFRAGRDVIKVFAGEASSKKISVQYECEANTPTLLNGDALKIQQVLAKLVENAIKFTDHGSVKLLICSKEKDEKNNPIIEFKVIDTGVGISDEKQAMLFDFANEKIARTPQMRKISLELAVCKKIIEAMNGTINIDSKKNEGTEFTIQIALKETPTDQIEEFIEVNEDTSTSSNLKSYTGLKVLLAEDDPINQSLGVAFLKKLGGEIDTANNGKQAVDKFQQGSYDIIFMDCEMPEMDGYEATRAIRKLEEETGAHIPIMAMTAYAGRGDKEYCLSAGMDDHIPKPVTVDVLEDVLEKYIIPDLTN